MLRLRRAAFEYYREPVVAGFWRMRYISEAETAWYTRDLD